MSEQNLFDLASKAWDEGHLKEAFDLFYKLANEGDPSSQNNLGYFFDEGIGVDKDIKKALYWYKKAAKQGNSSSYINISKVYQAQQNIRRAKFWLLKAVNLGDGEAALELAKIYLEIERKNNILKAINYLQMSVNTDPKYISEESLDEAKELLNHYGE